MSLSGPPFWGSGVLPEGGPASAAEAAPDVICLQETKVTNALFPRAAVRAMGYPHLLVHG